MATETASGSTRYTFSEDGTLTVSGRGPCLIKVADGANYGSGTLTIDDDLAVGFDGTLDSADTAVSLTTGGKMITVNAPPSCSYKVRLTLASSSSPTIPVGVHFDQASGL